MFDSATKQLSKHWVKNGPMWKTQQLIQCDRSTLIWNTWSLTRNGEQHVRRGLAQLFWPFPDSKQSNFHIGEIAVVSNPGFFSNAMPALGYLHAQFPKVLGIDLESSSMYPVVVKSWSSCNFLMVKAVQHYFHEEDDTFREYGCELSAAWAIEFMNQLAVDTTDFGDTGNFNIATLCFVEW